MTTATTATPARPGAVHVPVLVWPALVLALFTLFLVTQESGALLEGWETLHELFHDGRHLLGVPCH